MSQPMSDPELDLEEIEDLLVTEDDEPVDNMFSAKQQRLLVESLYTAWTPPPREDDEDEEGEALSAEGPRKFLADANVGVFFSVHEQPMVPDMFLSMDVELKSEWIARQHRSYFIWRFGKAPDVVVEIVSNRKGGEMQSKRKRYAQIGVQYYIVFDPFGILKGDPLYVYEVGFGKRFRRREDYSLPGVGLSLTLWEGRYEEWEKVWLRWLDAGGNLIPTAKEFADAAKHEADNAVHRADEAAHRADEAEQLAVREAEARRRAEAEATQLREELERLRQQ